MNMDRRLPQAAGTVAIVLALCAVSARAAAGPAEQAAGVALFQEAKKLAAAGDYEHACPKFVEAQRLFPTAGTLLNLGDCYDKLGKHASAWGAFKQAEITARNAGDTERQEEAARRAKALEGGLSRLTISVAGSPASGIEVRRDGDVVGEGQWGTAVPVDPGEHVVEVSAPGRQKWATKVRVVSGGVSIAVSIPELPPAPTDTKAPEGSSFGPQRIAGVAMGGAGVVGLVVGAVFGARAIAKNNDSKAQCSPTDPTFCNDMGVALRHDAKTAGTVSTAAIVTGSVLVAGGTVLTLTAPTTKAKEAARLTLVPRFGGGELGVTLEGRW